MGLCFFGPPPCEYFHRHPGLVPSLRSHITRILLLHLSVLLYQQRDVSFTDQADPSLATFLSVSNFTLPGSRAYTPSGGGQKDPGNAAPRRELSQTRANAFSPQRPRRVLLGVRPPNLRDKIFSLPCVRIANQSYLSTPTTPPRQRLLLPVQIPGSDLPHLLTAGGPMHSQRW